MNAPSDERLRRTTSLVSQTLRFGIAAAGGTLVAFSLLLFRPFWGQVNARLRNLSTLRLPTHLIAQTTTILLLLLVMTLLTGTPRKLWRSLRLGLITWLDWILVPAIAGSWIAFDLGHPYLAAASVGTGVLVLGVLHLLVLDKSLPIEITQQDFEPDIPVPEGGNDLLDREELIQNVVSTILLQPPPIIAVTGKFGDGKTSFLNLVVGQLRESKEIEPPIIVSFSPWLTGDSNALVLSLLNSIVATVKQSLFVPGLSGDVARYARTLLSAVPWTERLKDLIGEPSQESRIDALVRRIARMRRRVLVVLDDLDRLEAKELETVLKLLRGSDKLSNVTFVCAFDKTEVSLILRNTRKHQDTTHFIEKFFPVEYRLPEIAPLQLHLFFFQRIEHTLRRGGLEEIHKSIEDAWEHGVKQHFLNLRRIKIFFNRINRSLELIAPEVNAADFIRLELIRDIAPSLYGLIFHNSEYFWNEDLAFEVYTKNPKVEDRARQEREEFYENRVKSLVGERAEVLGLLENIFPNFAAYRKKGKPTIPEGAEKDRRIFHPRYFWQYFLLKVPSQLFSQKDFSAFVRSLSRISEEEVAEAFGKQFRAIKSEDFKRWYFIHLIEGHFDKFELTSKKGLSRGMARNSAQWSVDAFEMFSAVSCTHETLKEIVEEAIREKFLSELIQECESDFYALLLLWRLYEKEKENPSRVQNTLEVVKPLLASQLRSHYGVPYAPSVFEQYGSLSTGANRIEPNQFLFNWQRLGGESESDAKEYLRTLLSSRPENINDFLASMFRVSFIDDYATLKPLIDYEYLNGLIDQHVGMLDPAKVQRFKQRHSMDPEATSGDTPLQE